MIIAALFMDNMMTTVHMKRQFYYTLSYPLALSDRKRPLGPCYPVEKYGWYAQIILLTTNLTHDYVMVD